jgi:hypothetical protein
MPRLAGGLERQDDADARADNDDGDHHHGYHDHLGHDGAHDDGPYADEHHEHDALSGEDLAVPPGRAARPEAASSVAPVASGYARSLRPCLGTTIAPLRRAAFRQPLLGVFGETR